MSHFNFDKQLYLKLLRHRSRSSSEMQNIFRDWLLNYLKENISNAKFSIDTYGNLYVEKGSSDIYNCVIGHLDINQSDIDIKNLSIIESGGWLVGFDNSVGKQVGLGHDDKAGVYFCIEALKNFENIKAFFPLDEEIGCIGSRNSNADFFSNVGFMVQLDRRGFTDVSTYSNGNNLLTKETQEELNPILDTFGFSFTKTMLTDVGQLVGSYGIQGTNISTAYTREHTDSEALYIPGFIHSSKFAFEILKQTQGKKYTIEQPPKPVYQVNKYSNYGNNGLFRNYGKKKDADMYCILELEDEYSILLDDIIFNVSDSEYYSIQDEIEELKRQIRKDKLKFGIYHKLDIEYKLDNYDINVKNHGHNFDNEEWFH